MEIKITKSRNLKEKPDSNGLGFGQIFSDHMFMMEYNKKEGWHDARIVPYGPLSLDPASTVFHYGAEIFEGLKAYRRPDGKVQLFRPHGEHPQNEQFRGASLPASARRRICAQGDRYPCEA